MINQKKQDSSTNQNNDLNQLKDSTLIDNNAIRQTDLYKDTEHDLNSKILKVTLTIQEEFPELTNFLEELTAKIPKNENPNLELKNLAKNYATLNEILEKYRLEHSHKNNIKNTDGTNGKQELK